MKSSAIKHIRQAIEAAREVAQSDLSDCDAADIDELVQPVERELDSSHPNVQTLGTFLNSLARSLRTDPAAREVCLQLDAAMREAGVPSNWENI
jgi:hypothetical protein